ncbi:hypothetical protein [Saccharothrix sp.]|uniref:hypothetical protein n=1 Tax=Saccharothrix sp. TaxID=1873460 RepID=UPI0028128DF6|nr:hypothetical protein [Saccharothrix sp.]
MDVVVEENGLLGAVAGVGGAIGRAVGDMFAAEKHLNDTLAGAPAGGTHFAVDKDDVLNMGKVIQDQVTILQLAYAKALSGMRINLNGMDEVNADIAEAWNDRLLQHPESYAARVDQYIASLSGLAEQLRKVAEQYGFTEEEINAAMGAVGASR